MFFLMIFALIFALIVLFPALMVLVLQREKIDWMDCEIKELTAAYQKKDRQMEYVKNKIVVNRRVYNKLLNELQKDLEV